MKKIILLFAMMLTVGTVSAKTSKLYASFASVSGNNNISWNASTNTLSVWGGNSNTYQMFSFEAGTLSKYTKLHIPIDNTNYAHVRIMLMNGSTTVFTGRFGSGGNKTITLSGWNSYGSTLTDEQIATITAIRIGGYEVSSFTSESPCTFSIDPANVYLETLEYEGMDINTPIAELYWYSYSTNEEYDRSTSALSKQLNKDVKGNNQILYGPYSGNATTAYMNVAGYDNAVFTLNTAGAPGIRLMYNSETITIDTDNTKKSYTQSVTTMPKIATIKTKNGSDANSFNIASINFVKEFNASSETAFAIAASSSSSIAYDRTFTVGQKSTVCLPFALTADEVEAAGTFYELTSADGDALTFTSVATTVAYKPYIFQAKMATPFANFSGKEIVASDGAVTSYTVGDYTILGTLAHQSVPQNAFGYNASTGAFSKATSDGVTIDAFRAYITAPGGAPARLNVAFSDDETTGIASMKQAQPVSGEQFNLQGMRVSGSYKGLVIRNGKKMLKK